MKSLLTGLWKAVALAALGIAVPAGAQVRTELADGWEFIRQDMANTWEVFRPVKAGKPESVPLWKPVSVPHCYNAHDGVAPDVNYYQGPAWYRRWLKIQNPYPNGHTLLVFEGCGPKTQVYVGSQLVGSHVGSYDLWTVDITSCGSGELPLAIRCDNSRDVEMLPSDMSDFCLYGGICRQVWLVYQPEHYLSDVRIDVKDDQIIIDDSVPLQVEIIAPDGKTVFRGDNSKPVRVRHPHRWDVDSPQLYTVRLNYGEQHLEKQIGFRTFEFRDHGPFFLNGRRLLLNGTHRHEDHSGVGAAMSKEQVLREFLLIKQMGANFIRLGHYPQSDYVLHLCDSLGLLVWEEIPWCRGGVGGSGYQQQAREQLETMISRHRHHPSIILWGLGNENDWPGDFSTVLDTVAVRRLMTELNAEAHQLDDSRMTVIRRCDFCADIVDVYSPSIWAGWYSRRFTDYAQMELQAIGRYPRFLHAEWGGDSHAGRHAETGFDIEAGDRNGDWSESYIVRLFDWHLKEQAKMPLLTGSAFWTFKDFCTPLRPENPIPYVNQKGVCQRDGTPKESYYVVQSYWSRQPMLHIYGHSWPVRWGKEGEPREVLVYSNQPEVELFLNGVSQGRRQRHIDDYPAQGFHWNLSFRKGTNTLKAVAGNLEDEIVFEYQTETWRKPAGIVLTQTGGNKIEAQLCDSQGIRCLDATDWITFSIAGDGELLINQGTATGSQRIQAANGRAAIQLKNITGDCVVSAKSPGLPSAFLYVKEEKADAAKTDHLQ